MVAADGGRDRVAARLPDGTVRELDIEEFTELVAADLAGEALPADTPVVLAVPSPPTACSTCPAGSRTAPAVRCGRTAAGSPSSPRPAKPPPSTSSARRRPPRGDWIASAPGLGPDPDDDVPAWHHEVVSRALVSALTGRQIGLASHHPAEFAEDFEEDDRHLDRMGTFVHDDPATDRLSGAYDLPGRAPRTGRTGWTCTAAPAR
ncbi:hypothetical protein EQG64_27965 [Streptomyces sp. S6]|nr:hypothetical protein EQG64_27965 [Streptomyces sp. S6]